jgi:hypothetical protein
MNDSIHVIRRPRRAGPRTARTAAAVIATAALTLLAAACSGSPSSASGGSTTAGGSTHSQSTNSQMLAYSQCVREHGVPNFPDPDSNGNLDKNKIRQTGVSDSRLRAATAACKDLNPNSQPPSQAQLQQEFSDMSKFAVCMRNHGVTNMPNPTPGGSGRYEFNLQAAGIATHDGLPTSPQILAKAKECEHLLPQSMQKKLP